MDHANVDTTKPVRMPGDPLQELRVLGEFHVLRLLGDGGMGSVFLAFHENQGCQVALKVLAEQLNENVKFVERFYREARNGILLNHPNIVRCLTASYDQVVGKHYLVMEYIDGPSVLETIDRFEKLSLGDSLRITLDIARALEHAHTRNIIHRDIKPGNILLTSSGLAKLADLGLAKRVTEVSQLTLTKQGIGTPHYMPYEQAMHAKKADSRSDIYALGATLYHMLTGQLPFSADNPVAVMEKKSAGVYTPASQLVPELPRQIDMLLAKMLAREPRDRYQMASELIQAIERLSLASPVLSFIDPDLALRDPWVQASLSKPEMPTLLDVNGSGAHKNRTKPAEVWYLRYRNRRGKLCFVKGTTEQVCKRLAEGRLSRHAQASSHHRGTFRTLDAYPEFRAALDQRAQLGSSATDSAFESELLETNAQTAPTSPWYTWRAWLYVGLGLTAGAVALAGVAWLALR